MTISLILSLVQVFLKILPEILDLKAKAEARNEKFEADEKALYQAAKKLLEKALTDSRTESQKAKTIDEIMDEELRKHEETKEK